jgi:hypothetical protein
MIPCEECKDFRKLLVVSKKVIKELKLENSLVKKQNSDLTKDLNYLCQRLYDDLISSKQETQAN